MSDGKIHFEAWSVALVPSAVVSTPMILVSPVLWIGHLCGYLSGSFVEPDLDQIGLSSSEGRAMRSFKIFGVFWVMFWMPYAYLIPHRSPLSHWPYLGAALRLLYLSIIPVFFIWWFDLQILKSFNQEEIILFLIGLWNGLSWSDSVHFFLDTHLWKRLSASVIGDFVRWIIGSTRKDVKHEKRSHSK